MNMQPRHLPILSILGGFLGAALFQLAMVGVNVEAEESPTAIVDSISVKQLNLYNHKNEVVAKLTSDSFGLPKFELGRNELSRIDFGFVTENQPAITVVGGLGRSMSVMSIQNQGSYWEPMISLAHKDRGEGVLMSIFNNNGNIVLTNNEGDALKFDASQASAWRNVAFHPRHELAFPSPSSLKGIGKARYSTISGK